MEKKSLRLILMLLTAVLAAITIMAGCGGTTATTTQAATTTSSALATTTTASPETTTSTAPATTSSTTAEVTNVRLMLTVPVKTMAVFYILIPQELGYYQQEGLNVSMDVAGSAGTIVSSTMTSGQADIGLDLGSSVVYSWAAGRPVIAVADFQTHPVFSMIVPKDSAIKSYADLIGKTIGIKEVMGGDIPTMTAELAKAGGIVGQNVQTVVVGNDWNTIFTKFKSGEIVAYNASFNDLFGIQENPDFAYRTIDPPLDPTKPRLNVPIVVTKEFLANHRQAVIGLCRAIAKAQLFAQNNPDAVLAMQSKIFPPETENVAYAKGAIKVAIEYSTPLGDNPYGFLSVEGAKSLINDLVNPGQASGLEKAFDPTPFMDLSLIPEINNFDHDKVIQDAKNSTLTFP